jgi:uncharacterized protein YdeI (YjbR/CyaY-like superfamily)
MTDLPVTAFANPTEWEAWLAANQTCAGVWLKLAKKGAATATVTYAEALDVALCYGWIDGQKGRFDDHYWVQRFTPRKPRSKWSKINCEKATKLIAQRRMQPAGLEQVSQAKADGRWDAAYESQSAAAVPDDLQRALEANPKAQRFFSTLDRANRYAILYRVHDAKKPETRARRIAEYVAMLAEGKKIHPSPRRPPGSNVDSAAR